VSRTFIRWVGGKSKVARQIAELIPFDHLAYVEPFFGSGAVLFAKSRSKVEIANDINEDVIAFFRVVKDRPSELVEAFRYTLVHEATFQSLADTQPTDELQRAVRFYFLSRTCFAGDVSKPYFSPSARSAGSPNTNWIETIEQDALEMHSRIRTVVFLCRPAEEVLKMADSNSVVYCDPPYPGTHGYSHDLDWDFMLDWLENTDARWILSINDIPLVREKVIPHAINRGGSVEKISLYRGISRDDIGRGDFEELLITNFPQSKRIVVADSDFSDLPLFRSLTNGNDGAGKEGLY
jgi:DNA adenine methylase